MKFAIIADIHANLEALQAVLAHTKQQSCTHYAFLGDFVGYCADPKACVDLVRAMNAPCVKGNHDEYCAADLPLDDLNLKARKNVEWTRKQLPADDRDWLQALPYTVQVEGFSIVHSSLECPERRSYGFDKLAATASLTRQQTALCFFGHTHVPLAFVRDGIVRGGTFTKLNIEPGKQYFVNPGSVGQPRDQNPNAAYVIYEVNKGIIELHRVPYDIAAAQRKIQEAGLAD